MLSLSDASVSGRTVSGGGFVRGAPELGLQDLTQDRRKQDSAACSDCYADLL